MAGFGTNGGNGNWKFRMAQWMQGRYGLDELSQALMIVACALIVVNFFVHSGILSTLALIGMILSIFRMYSRNFAKRRAELDTYQRLMVRPKREWRLLNQRWINRKTTVYFKCKGCGTVLNVPKGKGKLRVTCPKCGTKTERKS